MEHAANQRRRLDAGPGGLTDASARQRRVDREAEAHAAIGRLTLAGDLVGDGPDRRVLPGFGAGTWRAIGMLRSGVGEAASWATAVASGPASDLGPDGPQFLDGLVPDRRLVEPAARLHLIQAYRQDVRNALLVTEFAMGVALDAGNERGVASLRAEADTRVRQLEHLDAELERAWASGASAALGYAAE